MATWFDESRLDDEAALATADARLRELAEAGARVRREAVEAAPGIGAAVAAAGDAARPRAIVAAGPDSRLLRAVLEPWCPVPFVAWPGPALPGWAGALDLVVVLAPDGTDRGTAAGTTIHRLHSIPGQVASPLDPLNGCAFSPRCALADAACEAAMPPLAEVAASQRSRCLKWSVTSA